MRFYEYDENLRVLDIRVSDWATFLYGTGLESDLAFLRILEGVRTDQVVAAVGAADDAVQRSKMIS